jgi:PAS domain S-box-containing protein
MVVKSNSNWNAITIFVICSMLIITSIAGFFLYRNQKASHLAEKAHELESINRFKIKQVSEWYKDEINDAATIANNSQLLSRLKIAFAHPTSENKSQLTEYLVGLKSEHGYSHIFITSLTGKVLFTDSDDTLNNSITSDVWLQQLASNESVTMSLYFTSLNRANLDVMSLVDTGYFEPAMAIIFRIDPESFLFPLLSYTTYSESSSKTFLFSRFTDSIGIELKKPRKNENYGKLFRLKNGGKMVTSVHMVTDRVFGGSDQNNKDILAFSEPIPYTPWVLFSKIDQQELLKSFNRQAMLILLLSSMAFLAVLIAVSFIFSRRQQNIFRELLHSQQEFRTTLYSIGDAVIITDNQGKITLMNKEAELLTGYTENDAVNNDIEMVFKLFDENSMKIQENPARKILNSVNSISLEENGILLTKDSRKIPISNSAAPIKDEISQTMGVVLIFRDKTEDQKRESALIESEKKYYRMFADSPQPMWIYDLTTLAFLEVNQAAILHYGYSRDEFLSMTIKDIRPKEDIPLLLADVASTVDSYNNAGIWRHIKKNGELIYVSIKSHEVIYGNGIARHVLANDITDIKTAQSALQESETKFRQLFEGHSAIKLIIDPLTVKIVDANDAAARFYGYSRDEFIGLDLEKINTAGTELIRSEIDNVVQNRKIHFEFIHRKKDGSVCDVEVFSSKIMISGKIFLHSVVHDVTEKTKAKHQVSILIQSIEQSPVGIVITNPEGFVEFANSRMSELTGYAKSEIIGKLSKALHTNAPDRKLQRRIWSTIRAGEIWKGEIEDSKKDGTAYWSKVAISPIFDDEEAIKHFVMVYEDVTEQKKMLSELIKAKTKAEESDQLKTAFLANMSHEIRTPMNGILGFIDLLQDPNLTGDQFDEYISIVKASGERLISTITDIIDISKIESGQSTLNESTVDVNKLIIDLYNFFRLEAENKNLEFTIISLLPEKSKFYLIDNSKLESILINLIKNALKFTKTGEIEIGVTINNNNNMLEFTVTDTGIGIPHDRLHIIFERFVQAEVSIARDYEGSGLGLSIAKAFVEMMNGDISVVSTAGKGSVFSFRIPAKQVHYDENENITIHKKGKIKSKIKILVAEDDAISYIYLRTMLSKYGIEIIHASNGAEAIELCIANPDISLVLMDMKMPLLDGYQATTKILELRKGLPIVALTAFALSDDREKALACGCIDYVSKPVKKELLIEVIKKHSGIKAIY